MGYVLHIARYQNTNVMRTQVGAMVTMCTHTVHVGYISVSDKIVCILNLWFMTADHSIMVICASTTILHRAHKHTHLSILGPGKSDHNNTYPRTDKSGMNYSSRTVEIREIG